MGLSVRFATPADAATVHRFIVELAAYEREPTAVETTVAVLARQLDESPPPFECLLAEEDGEARGFALFFHNYSTWRGRRGIWLEDLYVPEAERGRGIGKRLLEEVAHIALERGCARLEWSVLDWNAPAIAFYLSLGAVALDGWTTHRLSDAALAALARISVDRG